MIVETRVAGRADDSARVFEALQAERIADDLEAGEGDRGGGDDAAEEADGSPADFLKNTRSGLVS